MSVNEWATMNYKKAVRWLYFLMKNATFSLIKIFKNSDFFWKIISWHIARDDTNLSRNWYSEKKSQFWKILISEEIAFFHQKWSPLTGLFNIPSSLIHWLRPLLPFYFYLKLWKCCSSFSKIGKIWNTT